MENQDFVKPPKIGELSKSGTNLWKTKIISRSPKLGSEGLVVRICGESRLCLRFRKFGNPKSGTNLWKTKIISRFLKKEAEKSMTYDNWQGRITDYDFAENTDYLLNKIIVQVPSGKKYKNEYFLTLDMAKELAMVENNESGLPAPQNWGAEKSMTYDNWQCLAVRLPHCATNATPMSNVILTS